MSLNEYMKEYRKDLRLFSEVTQDKIKFEFTGSYFRSFKLNNNTYAVITKAVTVNKNLIKACLWHEGKIKFCTRYNKDGFGVLKAQDMIVSFCMEEGLAK